LRFAGFVALTWLFALPFGASSADAAWATYGNPASLATLNQVSAQSISDGAGGIILVWEDYRNGDADIYAQRLDNTGLPLWGPNGIAVAAFPTAQESPVIVADGAGGAVVAWQDLRNGQYDIYAQAMTTNGGLRWDPAGIEICRATGHKILQVITSDAAGGAIIAWRDQRTGDSDIYAQRVTFAGTPSWLANGVGICVVPGLQTSAKIEVDPRGGAYIVWRDRRNGAATSDIYAQSVTEDGVARWTSNGVPVCAAVQDQLEATIVPDGKFGLIVTWHDFRNGVHYDVWAQRIKPDGTPRWTVDGVRLTNATGQQTMPIVVSDGLSGAIVGWTDARVTRPDIYAQRVDSSGVIKWAPADGVAICSSDSSQFIRTAVSDGLGGAIFGWDDDRAGFNEVFAQAVGGDGVTHWTGGGIKIATGSGFRTLTTACPDGYHGAVFGWQDFRGGINSDVYAYRITSVGTAVEPTAAPRVPARIYPARPNPFNPSTVLEFSLDVPSSVTFAIHDVQGRRVRVLTEGTLGVGRHTYRWDGADQQGRACGSGVYFVKLSLPQGSRSTAITLIR